MAEPYDTLLQVQEHDTVLDQLRHRIEAMPERAELADVRARQSALVAATAQIQIQVDALTVRQRELEQQIAASAKRRHDIEERMRTGGVTAARDLQAMDHEVGQLVERQRTLEDDELLLMEEEEPLDLALVANAATATVLEAEAARLVATVAANEVELRAAMAETEIARADRASGLPEELAERYERLRSHLGGVGAARLVGERCDGCHLTLSSVEVERLHQLPADTFASCPQCDRILVH